ncbi:hypothetical protein, unlikely [Trypanosoma congolense IL3000]|uniref:Uncharacterized protein n=1 Tax=Trypanosoma congolense (strain IL3000) TaxID=1068625 RepID=F9WBZ1_TRYCI|nr:hypothetical protein, unlikely [Trypanosoma congolense IL3000]
MQKKLTRNNPTTSYVNHLHVAPPVEPDIESAPKVFKARLPEPTWSSAHRNSLRLLVGGNPISSGDVSEAQTILFCCHQRFWWRRCPRCKSSLSCSLRKARPSTRSLLEDKAHLHTRSGVVAIRHHLNKTPDTQAIA